MLQAQNQNYWKNLARRSSRPSPASRRNTDIRQPQSPGVAGVLVGRSLCEGTLTLPDARAAAS